MGNVVTHLVVHWHSYIFYVRESVSVHLSPSDINFVIRWWAQRPVWMSAYLPVLCDCINSSVENLHCNAPITDAPQALDFKQTSKKHNRNYYLAVGSTAATTRFIYILLTGVLPLWKPVKRKTASLALTLQNTVCVLKFPCKLLFSGKKQVQYNGSLYIDLSYLHK